MKILINRTPKLGPWGGGVKTVNKLVTELEDKGHQVVYRLEPNIDIIFCMDPRPNEFGEWYQNYLNYKVNNGSKIIQRVGDLGTHSKPKLTRILRSCYGYSDFLIFPSEWAKDYLPLPSVNYEVVDNAPMRVFHENKNFNLNISNKPKLVTHHWSTNPKKGFEIYSKLQDHILSTDEYEFSYIGRLPEHVKLKNHTQPLSAKDLSVLLPKNDIYITASREEAGANHVLEAMAAGLPIVYHSAGGSINNYCEKYGNHYSDFEGLLDALKRTVSEYSDIKRNVLLYDKDNSYVVARYLDIIERVYNEEEQN